jgi:hypothetical protein
MLGMSVKSVPGCLVLIDPRLIGVPVALTPGLGPHDEVSLEPPLELVAVVVLELAPLLAAALELLLLLLLLPHPASSRTAPASRASAMLERKRKRSP